MKRPMIFILFYLIIGILVRRYLANTLDIAFFSLAIFLSCILLFFKFKFKFIFVLICFYLLGFFLTSNQLKNSTEFSNKTVTLTGTVKNVVTTSNNNSKIYFDVTQVDGINKNFLVCCSSIGKIDVSVSDYGKLSGKLELLDDDKNIGEYNEFLNERSKGVNYKMFSNNFTVIKGNKNIAYYLFEFRNKLSDNYNKLLQTNDASIVEAMILGENGIDPNTQNLYKIGGIYHILAISGLHVGILSAFIFIIFKFLLKNNLANYLTIIILIFYDIFTGCNISTTRAVLMTSVFLLSEILKRDNNSFNSILVSALILLVYQPLYLFRAGFLLSFVAILGVILLTGPIEIYFLFLESKINLTFVKKINRFLIPVASPAIAAFLSTTPVIAYFFYNVYPYSILVNLLVVLTIPLVIIISFLVGILSLIYFPIASFLSSTIHYILIYYDSVCKFFSVLPFAKILVGRPSIIFLILYYFVIVIFILIAQYKYSKYKFLKVFGFIGLTSIIFMTTILKLFDESVNISLLNNKSDAIIIYDKKNIFLVDEKTSSSNNILNYINAIGREKLNGIFVPIMDKKNTKNTIFFLNNHLVDKVYIEKSETKSDFYNDFSMIASDNNVKIEILKTNNVVNDGKIKIQIDANNLKLVYNKTNFFITTMINNNFDLNSANVVVYDGKEEVSSISPDILIGRFLNGSKSYAIKKDKNNIYLKLKNNKITKHF